MRALVRAFPLHWLLEPEPVKPKEKKLTEAERTKIISSLVDDDQKVVKKISKLYEMYKYVCCSVQRHVTK